MLRDFNAINVAWQKFPHITSFLISLVRNRLFLELNKQHYFYLFVKPTGQRGFVDSKVRTINSAFFPSQTL